MKNTPAIDLRNVTVTFAGTNILKNINWQLNQGNSCGIIGPNGSGKSTLMAVLAGYLWPTKGSVSVLGNTFGKVDLNQLRKNIGLIEPSRMPPFNPHMTVRQVVATGLFGSILLGFSNNVDSNGWQKVDRELNALSITNLAKRKFGTISTGEQTKTLIARAFVSHARLLIFDEPTVGLDIGARAQIVKAMDDFLKRDPNATIIVVSHHLDELPQKLDRIMMLKNGRIFREGPDNQTLTSENLTQLFEYPMKVTKNNGRYMAFVK